MEIDARGLSCPIPVVKTKKVMDSDASAEIVVLVDDDVAKENVSRLGLSKGYEVAVETEGDGYRLVMRPGAGPASE